MYHFSHAVYLHSLVHVFSLLYAQTLFHSNAIKCQLIIMWTLFCLPFCPKANERGSSSLNYSILQRFTVQHSAKNRNISPLPHNHPDSWQEKPSTTTRLSTNYTEQSRSDHRATAENILNCICHIPDCIHPPTSSCSVIHIRCGFVHWKTSAAGCTSTPNHFLRPTIPTLKGSRV